MAKGNDASRTIPKKISDAVKFRDYYRCLWCGTHLYERHHILEFFKGGAHTIENLALLCPNCHTLIHKGSIDPLDLLDRIQKQKKSDRLNGMFSLDMGVHPKFLIGNVEFFACNPVIRYAGQPLLFYRLSEANELLISYKFYNKESELIFWMHDNSFWASADFECSSSQGSLYIKSTKDSQYLSIKKKGDDTLHIKGLSYLYGKLLSFDDAALKMGNIEIRNLRFTGFETGLEI